MIDNTNSTQVLMVSMSKGCQYHDIHFSQTFVIFKSLLGENVHLKSFARGSHWVKSPMLVPSPKIMLIPPTLIYLKSYSFNLQIIVRKAETASVRICDDMVLNFQKSFLFLFTVVKNPFLEIWSVPVGHCHTPSAKVT